MPSINDCAIADITQKKMLGGKEGKDQQGTELNDMTNSRGRPTANAYLPQPGTLPPLPTFRRNTPGVNVRTARHARVDSSGLPVIQDVGNLLRPTRRRQHTIVGWCGPGDKPEEAPPLPREWDEEHDRAICFLASFPGHNTI
jgi:hypothetical protein